VRLLARPIGLPGGIARPTSDFAGKDIASVLSQF